MRRFFLACLILLAPAPALAQVDVVDDVVVEGLRSNEDTAFRFLRSVSVTPMGARTMAVWDSPICLAVYNQRPEDETAVRERILGRAEGLGVEISNPGCRPNVMAIFTADARATADDLLDRNGTAFRPTTGSTQLERSRLRRFIESDRPVRWWSVSMPVDLETGHRVVALAGEHIFVTHFQSKAPGAVGQTGGPPWRKVRGIQPRGADIRDILQISFVIIDARQVRDVPIGALGDYLSMVILSQADMEADTRQLPTILNLFEANSGLTEMSQWDRAYLRALYSAPVDFSNIRFQQQEIARRMVEDQTPSSALR